MTPTTILIEREADAKVFEVLEQLNSKLRWKGGEKPTEYNIHVAPGKYVIVIKDDVLSWNYPIGYQYPITATEWLARYGYVWYRDGYRPLQVGDTVVTDYSETVPIIMGMKNFDGKSGKITNISNDNNYEVHGWWWPRSACKYVAPVSAPHDNDSLDAMKYAMCGVVKFRTEQREKRLKQAGYVKEHNYWQLTRNGKCISMIGVEAVETFTDSNFNDLVADNALLAQPAPYTAGQEVEYPVPMIPGETMWYKATIDHIHNGIAYLKVLDQELPQPFKLDSIRPVQVQPEMPEWEKFLRKFITDYGDKLDTAALNDLVAMLRPLITPKQVTDEEIRDNWDLQKRMNRETYLEDAIALVRWALQKAEGGEG